MVRQGTPQGERPKRGSPHWLKSVAALAMCCSAHECDAVERVVLEVGQVSTANVQATGATITLDVSPRPDSPSPTLRTQIAQLHLAAPGITYSDVDIGCTDLLVKQPQFACNQGSVAARGGP